MIHLHAGTVQHHGCPVQLRGGGTTNPSSSKVVRGDCMDSMCMDTHIHWLYGTVSMHLKGMNKLHLACLQRGRLLHSAYNT